MTKKPIIGLTEPSSFTEDCVFTIENFFQATPLKLCQNVREDICFWVDQCDGVMLGGGVDIHPRTYGYAVLNEYNFSKFDHKRDLREMIIIERCIEKDIPMIGICRGHQILGVYHGLNIIPDLTGTVVCHQPAKQQIAVKKDEPMHWVRLINDSESYQPDIEKSSILKNPISNDPRYLWVNSFHHQGLEFKPNTDQVDVLGLSPGHKEDKIIELMKGKTGRWISCQWHPEFDWQENRASNKILQRFQDLINGGSLPDIES